MTDLASAIRPSRGSRGVGLDIEKTGELEDNSDNNRRKEYKMPEICRFLGIVISMLYDDHAPPHFHAVSVRRL